MVEQMNDFLLYVFIISCAILFIIPLIFVTNSVYEDGIVWRIFLLGIAFGSATFILEVIAGTTYELMAQTVFLVAMFAGFLCWHLFRFHSRVLKQKRQLEKVESGATRERRSKWTLSR